MNWISKAALTMFALTVSNAAGAADLPSLRTAPAAPVMLPAFTWTGFHVGAQVGYAFGTDRTTEYLTATGAFTGLAWGYRTNSFVGGVFAGANYQASWMVLGIEGDVEAINAKGGFVDPGGLGQMSSNVQLSLRGRIGVAMDRLHVYATGGAAFAKIRYDYTNPVGPITETTESWRTGYTIGAGAEYAFSDNIIGRLEYRFTDFGKFRYASVVAFPGLLTGEQEPRFSTIRAGVGYKF